MQIQTPQSQLTPLLHVNYDQIYNQLVARLTPREMIFAKWRAGFGGIIQWDLPQDLTWQQLSKADSYDYQACMALLENVSSEAKRTLGSNKAMIDAVYSVPSLDYVYYSRTPQGEYRIMLAGWGYRFPTSPALNPLSYSTRKLQPVDIYFRADGEPVASLPVELVRNTSHVGLSADDSGKLNLGSQEVGATFEFFIPSYGRNFSITIEQGRQQYLVDLTVEKTIPEEIPAVDIPAEPEPINLTIDNIRIKFVNQNGSPVENATARFIQNGAEVASTGLLNDGVAVIESTSLQPGTVEVRLSSPTAQYPVFNMVNDPTELDYEVYFHEVEKSKKWPIFVAIAIAAVATIAAAAIIYNF